MYVIRRTGGMVKREGGTMLMILMRDLLAVPLLKKKKNSGIQRFRVRTYNVINAIKGKIKRIGEQNRKKDKEREKKKKNWNLQTKCDKNQTCLKIARYDIKTKVFFFTNLLTKNKNNV